MGGNSSLHATPAGTFEKLLKKNDSLLITELTTSTDLVRIQADKMLIPASILKIFTALVAMDALGDDYHFYTDFLLDPQSNLKVKGYGDPLLISENIPEIVNLINQQITEINDIILDGTYFQSPITIPGATKNSVQPYDAPNGSLCVNFNTVFFKRDQNGTYISAEPQTPLLPFVESRVTGSSLNQGRIILFDINNEHLLYAGHLLKYFLTKKITVNGTIHQGAIDRKNDKLILRYRSPYSMQDVIGKMLYYSNNFTANQILIAAGAAKYGSPGTLEKGVQAAKEYAANHLGLSKIKLREGAGLSTLNRISASMMGKILREFLPYRKLLRQQDREQYKTGTLTRIRTRAGYINTKDGRLISYVVILNSGKNSMEKVMKLIYRTYPSSD
jgi:D-alanyl-D-alanine carboxypeptidase/D-alanyl-D-alanine-endopeptidase (penicillin-binding protein 4)